MKSCYEKSWGFVLFDFDLPISINICSLMAKLLFAKMMVMSSNPGLTMHFFFPFSTWLFMWQIGSEAGTQICGRKIGICHSSMRHFPLNFWFLPHATCWSNLWTAPKKLAVDVLKTWVAQRKWFEGFCQMHWLRIYSLCLNLIFNTVILRS